MVFGQSFRELEGNRSAVGSLLRTRFSSNLILRYLVSILQIHVIDGKAVATKTVSNCYLATCIT
jgi:hypothetical protein